MLAFCTSPRFVDHATGPHHPERPDRIRAIARAVRQANLISSPDPFPNFQLDLGPLENPSSLRAIEIDPYEADEKWITLVHPPALLDHIRSICAAGGGVLDTGDTPVGPSSFDIAKLSLGAVLRCCDAVAAGEVTRAFAAVRPPGHHAEPDRSMGFCLFANVAIAAKYLQQRHAVGKIAIVDFDVHHGNGTQACFESDPSVLFISLHQHPRTCYPGSGYEYETGIGPGQGFTMNIPFDPGAEDSDYLDAMRHRVLPKLDQFRPEFLLISAGFDAHQDDPLANINLTESAFQHITEILTDAANTHCQGRIVSALEGGYHLRALARSTLQHLLPLAR